jgi:phosphoglucomutase
MEETTKAKIDKWLTGNYDEETKTTIQKLIAAGKETELVDCFYKDLEFGTGGLRGLMGVGTNRMNKYTIGMATQGLSNYLKSAFPKEQIKVAIAHDSRNNSAFFARVTADVFSANGLKVYFYPELRPTPQLSFSIRHFKCHSGIVITASHNPKEYNGYKAYWNDGAQVVNPNDINIIHEVQKITDINQVNFRRNEALIETIGPELDQLYLQKIKSLSVSSKAIERQKDLKIVYTSLHGTGIALVPPILNAFGFTNVRIVEEQAVPDGNFPTVVFPNPEESAAMSIGLTQAKDWDADLLMGTDPDSDRVGIGVKNHNGEFQLLNGNQTAVLLFNYLLEAWKAEGKFKGNEYVVKTIVTTDLLEKIAVKYGVKIYNTLTGFKFIAALIKSLEGKEKFIVGGEESFGYLVGDSVRDKDAIASCAMIAEMTAYAKDSGRSLFDRLIDIYVEHGFFKEKLLSITKPGKSGVEEIQAMMRALRANPPSSLGGSNVVELLDYDNHESTNLKTKAKTKINLPRENVLQFKTEDGSLITARPSGTEPKIKFYCSVKTVLAKKSDYDAVSAELDKKLEGIVAEIKKLAEGK